MKKICVITDSLRVSTRAEIDFIDISAKVQAVVEKSGVKNGIVNVFAPHATGIPISTELEPNLIHGIKGTLKRLIPKQASYAHPSNAHSHLRSVLFGSEKTLPIIDRRLAFGTRQSLVFAETDVSPGQRIVIVQVLGN